MTGEELLQAAFEIDGTKVQALAGSTVEVQFKAERKATKRHPAQTPEHYRVTFLTRQKPLPMIGNGTMAGVIVWIPSERLRDVIGEQDEAVLPSAGEAPQADSGSVSLGESSER